MADNKINVTVSANTRKNITVSSAQQSTEISASADTGRFWAQTAKNWAVSDVIVDNTDYSSKHYAQEAKTSAQNASNYEVSTRETYNSFLNASANALNELKTANEQSLENIEASRVDAVDSINTVKDESIATVENKANEALTLVNNGITQINTTKNTAVDSINATKTNILKDIEFVAEGEKEEIEVLSDEIKDNANTVNMAIQAGVERLNSIDSLKKNQITNCLLEVPQNIKLELVDGALTLKAGSKVYNGDGTVYTRSTDYTFTPSWGTGNGIFVFPLVVDSQIIGFDAISRNLVFSGDVAPTFSGDYAYWFDTTVKRVKYTNNAGASWSEDRALPLCLVSTNNSVITSIDQVFNGFGYIGSTVWVDKGVKVLIPNGRNKDGSLKNIEFTTNNVMTYSRGNAYSDYDLILNEGQIANSRLYLDETNNVMRKLDGGLAVQYATIGKVSADSAGKITSLQPKTTFHAVDYNEKAEIVSWCMPDYSRATTWSTTGGTVPYDAKVILYNTNATNSGGSGGWVTVNGLLEYCVRGNAYEATSPAYVAYLPKGAIVEANNMNYAYIIPLKGAN